MPTLGLERVSLARLNGQTHEFWNMLSALKSREQRASEQDRRQMVVDVSQLDYGIDVVDQRIAAVQTQAYNDAYSS